MSFSNNTSAQAGICHFLIGEEKPLLGCIQSVPKSWIFCRLAYFAAFLIGVWAILVVGSVEIAVPIVILLIMWQAGAPIMK
jgi:hypothetical protein